MKTFILNLVLIFSCSAQAGLLTLKDSPNKLEGLPTHLSAIENVSGNKYEIMQKGAGLRVKKIMMIKIKAYIGEYFADANTQAMHLQFLRDIDAEKIMGSFKEALEFNSIDLKNSDIQAFLKAVAKDGDVKENSSMTILSTRTPSQELLSYESPTGEITTLKVSSGLGQKIFSIWLGKPADEGMAELQKNFVK